mgnify:CR=1 FL=1
MVNDAHIEKNKNHVGIDKCNVRLGCAHLITLLRCDCRGNSMGRPFSLARQRLAPTGEQPNPLTGKSEIYNRGNLQYYATYQNYIPLSVNGGA